MNPPVLSPTSVPCPLSKGRHHHPEDQQLPYISLLKSFTSARNMHQSSCPVKDDCISDPSAGEVATDTGNSFPQKLYDMLQRASIDHYEDIISWEPNGKCFGIRQPEKFSDDLMPRCLGFDKLSTFHSLLRRFGFAIQQGHDHNQDNRTCIWHHTLFVRDHPDLVSYVIATTTTTTTTKSSSKSKRQSSLLSKNKKERRVMQTLTPKITPVTPAIVASSCPSSTSMIMEGTTRYAVASSGGPGCSREVDHTACLSSISDEESELTEEEEEDRSDSQFKKNDKKNEKFAAYPDDYQVEPEEIFSCSDRVAIVSSSSSPTMSSSSILSSCFPPDPTDSFYQDLLSNFAMDLDGLSPTTLPTTLTTAPGHSSLSSSLNWPATSAFGIRRTRRRSVGPIQPPGRLRNGFGFGIDAPCIPAAAPTSTATKGIIMDVVDDDNDKGEAQQQQHLHHHQQQLRLQPIGVIKKISTDLTARNHLEQKEWKRFQKPILTNEISLQLNHVDWGRTDDDDDTTTATTTSEGQG